MDAPEISRLWREEKFSYMLFTGKAGGGWREVDDGANRGPRCAAARRGHQPPPELDLSRSTDTPA
jgi:hypothetical protein